MASLTTEEKNAAEKAAEEVMKDTFGDINAVEFPIDLETILDSYALLLKKGDFKDPNISGAFSRTDSTIYVSGKESPERQQFTVAHELGHYKLHKDRTTEILWREKLWQFGSKDKDETAANWFVASLLMPKAAVERMWKITKNPSDLAKFFGVSKAAMYFRLKDMGLISR